ncbi:hypothetical protein F4776DRAFT_658661 [Hypoxylon sp. NC0597]|nr:hypothetical protein F4776DRAFT_658661 [Hypoxylon sp. NC0597]
MDPDLDSGLFGIQLFDSEDSTNDTESAEGTKHKKDEANIPTDRTAQSEEEFQAVRKDYKVKVENGEIWKTIKLPLGPGRIPKPEAQSLLHAVEELYFFRQYAKGAQFVRAVLGNGTTDSDDRASTVDLDTRGLLRYYEKKCDEKAELK